MSNPKSKIACRLRQEDSKKEIGIECRLQQEDFKKEIGIANPKSGVQRMLQSVSAPAERAVGKAAKRGGLRQAAPSASKFTQLLDYLDLLMGQLQARDFSPNWEIILKVLYKSLHLDFPSYLRNSLFAPQGQILEHGDLAGAVARAGDRTHAENDRHPQGARWVGAQPGPRRRASCAPVPHGGSDAGAPPAPSGGTVKMRKLEDTLAPRNHVSQRLVGSAGVPPAPLGLSPERNHASRRLEQAQDSTNKLTNRRYGRKVAVPPTPLFPQNVRILLIINISRKNAGNYATMCMIASQLGPILQKSTICFQHDKLWINSKTPTNARGSHDVYEQKGVNLKSPKSCRLFSIGCRVGIQKTARKLCPEATISMIANTVKSESGKAAGSYVIEIRPHIVPAPEKAWGISHDLYDSKATWPGIRETGQKLCD